MRVAKERGVTIGALDSDDGVSPIARGGLEKARVASVAAVPVCVEGELTKVSNFQ